MQQYNRHWLKNRIAFLIITLTAISMIAFHFLIDKPMKDSYRVITSLQQPYQQLLIKSDYKVPPGKVFSRNQLERYLAVQDHLRASLTDTDIELLKAKLKEMKIILNKKTTVANNEIDIEGMKRVLGEMKTMADSSKITAKFMSAQAEAIDKEEFSLAEYYWVRSQVLKAAHIEIDYSELPTLQQTGVLSIKPDYYNPRLNIELAAEYEDEIKNNLVFARLGM